jgi:hypothetical protein
LGLAVDPGPFAVSSAAAAAGREESRHEEGDVPRNFRCVLFVSRSSSDFLLLPVRPSPFHRFRAIGAALKDCRMYQWTTGTAAICLFIFCVLPGPRSVDATHDYVPRKLVRDFWALNFRALPFQISAIEKEERLHSFGRRRINISHQTLSFRNQTTVRLRSFLHSNVTISFLRRKIADLRLSCSGFTKAARSILRVAFRI